MWETWVQSLGWEDLLEKGMAYPLQYSGLENSMDCIEHGIAKSQTGLSGFHFTSLPSCTEDKNPAANAVDTGSIPGDGQGILAFCSPWSHKESDMTEQLNNTTKYEYTSTHTHTHTYTYI